MIQASKSNTITYHFLIEDVQIYNISLSDYNFLIKLFKMNLSIRLIICYILFTINYIHVF